VLQLDLESAALANARFALSPLSTAVGALWLLRDDAGPAGGGWRALVQETVRDRRLTLLGSLFTGTWVYVPDFITPEPTWDETVQSELHAVATVAVERLRFEMEAMVSGHPEEGLAGRIAPAVVREALERGEQAFAERAAAELDQLWRSAFAPRWAALRARMEADIAQRARTLARHGLAEVLVGLHPDITWDDGRLGLLTQLEARITGSTGLVMTPMVFDRRLRYVVDSMPAPVKRRPLLMYPALPGPDAPPDTQPRTDHALLGATRARLLADLEGSARTTSELGERHRLSPGTVSYHLGILHRAGLVTRTRSGQRVLYEQSSRARVLHGAAVGE
jgi:DNA-binding transcriptional ArsR family regulator